MMAHFVTALFMYAFPRARRKAVMTAMKAG